MALFIEPSQYIIALRFIFVTIVLLATDSLICEAQDQHLCKFCLSDLVKSAPVIFASR
jgi:hypothetical protein